MPTSPKPHWYCREILGGPDARYIRKILAADGETYIDAPRVKFSPEFTAKLREVAMAEVQRIKAARMGEPPTGMVQ